MKIIKKIQSLISSVLYRLLGLVELLLFLRFILKFLNADPRALAVDLIYRCSEIFIFPFKFIFPNLYWRDYLIEITTISAMIGYAILVFAIFQILRLFSRE